MKTKKRPLTKPIAGKRLANSFYMVTYCPGPWCVQEVTRPDAGNLFNIGVVDGRCGFLEATRCPTHSESDAWLIAGEKNEHYYDVIGKPVPAFVTRSTRS